MAFHYLIAATIVWLAAGAAGCGQRAPTPSVAPEINLPNLPLRLITAEQRELFDEGDMLFETTMRPADGLGPHFIQKACASCHRDDGRGPGIVPKMMPNRQVTNRLPPAVFGRGYIEAVADREIERMEVLARGRTNSIKGRVHRVRYLAEGNIDKRYHQHQPRAANATLIGRFGVKARIATLDEFTADALQNDMGLTSPLRPLEVADKDGLKEDGKPGIDVTVARVNALADYARLLEIPPRVPPSPEAQILFAQSLCSSCHTPTLQTRQDYPINALAGIDAPVFTDLLLHDMGSAMSDGMQEGDAGPQDFRTTPLIGLRFYPAFMHDGRARTVAAAIDAHGASDSEARDSVQAFNALTPAQQAILVRYVESL